MEYLTEKEEQRILGCNRNWRCFGLYFFQIGVCIWPICNCSYINRKAFHWILVVTDLRMAHSHIYCHFLLSVCLSVRLSTCLFVRLSLSGEWKIISPEINILARSSLPWDILAIITFALILEMSVRPETSTYKQEVPGQAFKCFSHRLIDFSIGLPVIMGNLLL